MVRDPRLHLGMGTAPRGGDDVRLQSALLDRLIDLDPDLPEDPAVTEAETFAGLRAALRRDLEMLLNTRAVPETPSPGLAELADSALAYGSLDFFSAHLTTDGQRRAFALDLKTRIERFEPRLRDLSVDLVSDASPSRRKLRLRIAARHVARPGLPPMVFETAMDPVAGRFTVTDAAGERA